MIKGVAVGSLNDARARLAQSAKISFVRSDVTFDSTFQTIYSLSSKYGFRLIGILDYRTLNHNNSFTLDDWIQVVTKSKDTYPLIGIWEIWNEPTLTKYQLGYMDGKPQHYFDLLKTAYSVLKSANSQNTVLGLGGAQLGIAQDYSFAQSVFSLGAATYMDAISVHAYPYKLNIGQSWDYYKQQWTEELSKYRQFHKPIWITETGIQSSQLSERDQANYLKNSHSFFEQQAMVTYVWFQLIDYYGSDGTLRRWGLLKADQTIKLAYDTYKRLQ